MTATDELRRLLDERGVEWSDDSDKNVTHTTWDSLNCWFNEYPDGWTSWGMAKHGTPSQAIEATLGRTCEDVETDPNWFSCSKCGCTCNVDYWSDGLGNPNYCPNCGAKVIGGDAE